jgi:glycosyltransferase involved in cell wall biosynthesis
MATAPPKWEIGKMPKVSVIIPTHNRAEYLRCAIESVLKQTFKDLEIIVVDDNSTDNTAEVVKRFEDRQIKYIRKNANKGPSAARNTAISVSTGKYIAFLDDDDEWVPNKLQRQIELLDRCQPNICGVYSNRLVLDKSTNQLISGNPQADKLRGNLLYQLLTGSPIHTSTVLLRKKCLDKVGFFDETMFYMEDRDLWIRLSVKWAFEYIDDPLSIAYVHKQGHLSESLAGQTAGREKLLQRYNKLFSEDKKSWSKLHLLQGAQYCQLNNMQKGRKNILKGIKIDPLNFKAYLHLLSSILGQSTYLLLRKTFRISR